MDMNGWQVPKADIQEKVAPIVLGWYRRANLQIVNFLITPEVLALPNKKENRPGLIDPHAYYLRNT